MARVRPRSTEVIRNGSWARIASGLVVLLAATAQLVAQAPPLPVSAVHVTRPLATTEGYGAGRVLVTVTLPGDGSGRVTLPQLQRAGAGGRWEGRFIAIPALVHLRLAGDRLSGACAERREGDSGRFEWIFFAFVLTLVTWIPLYLWWVQRQHDAPAEGAR